MIMNEGRLTLEHLYALAPAFLQFFLGGVANREPGSYMYIYICVYIDVRCTHIHIYIYIYIYM